ncbi:uncharacterized protein [Engystomops pustulosus]|uniref:uncharacterized protein n=1 Tax=Engystomops pustulosus TaxID=76066 RepID=UPI003AFA5616
MKISVVFLVIAASSYRGLDAVGDPGASKSGSFVRGAPQESEEQKVMVTKTKANSSPAVMRTFSLLKGQCGCFEFSGDKIVYKPGTMCDSILLCRMFHNIAIMHGVQLQKFGKFITSSPDFSELNYLKTSKEIDFKNINKSCLSKLLQIDVPSLLLKLQNLLCLFQQGKDEHNEALYKEFLKQLNTALKDVGCSLDEVLMTNNILEQITDNAGKIADQLVFEILKIADDLQITGKLLNVVCKLLGKTLSDLSGILGNVGSGVKNIVGGILG